MSTLYIILLLLYPQSQTYIIRKVSPISTNIEVDTDEVMKNRRQLHPSHKNYIIIIKLLMY